MRKVRDKGLRDRRRVHLSPIYVRPVCLLLPVLAQHGNLLARSTRDEEAADDCGEEETTAVLMPAICKLLPWQC